MGASNGRKYYLLEVSCLPSNQRLNNHRKESKSILHNFLYCSKEIAGNLYELHKHLRRNDRKAPQD